MYICSVFCLSVISGFFHVSTSVFSIVSTISCSHVTACVSSVFCLVVFPCFVFGCVQICKYFMFILVIFCFVLIKSIVAHTTSRFSQCREARELGSVSATEH